MFSGIEGLERHPGVIGNRAVDVHVIDIRIGQDRIVVLVATFDPELIGRLVQFLFITSAQGDDLCIGMGLVDRNELGAESETDHRNTYGS